MTPKPHTLWATFYTSLTAYAPRRPQKPGTRALNGRAQSRVRPSMPLQLLDEMPLSNRLRKRPPTQPRAQKCHRTKPAKIPLASVAAADLLIGVACALGPTKAALAESRDLKPSKNRTPQGTPNCQRKIFEDAFGEDLSKIEADWRPHLKRLGAPAA